MRFWGVLVMHNSSNVVRGLEQLFLAGSVVMKCFICRAAQNGMSW